MDKPKSTNPPVKPMMFAFILGWCLFLVPFMVFVATPLIAIGIIAAVVCLVKGEKKWGIRGLLFGFIVSPAIFYLGLWISAKFLVG